MKLSSLMKIKALVAQLNNRPYEEEIKLFMPHMFSDGKWACDVKLAKFPESNTITPIVELLNQEGCNWWLSATNGLIYFHVQ